MCSKQTSGVETIRSHFFMSSLGSGQNEHPNLQFLGMLERPKHVLQPFASPIRRSTKIIHCAVALPVVDHKAAEAGREERFHAVISGFLSPAVVQRSHEVIRTG